MNCLCGDVIQAHTIHTFTKESSSTSDFLGTVTKSFSSHMKDVIILGTSRSWLSPNNGFWMVGPVSLPSKLETHNSVHWNYNFYSCQLNSYTNQRFPTFLETHMSWLLSKRVCGCKRQGDARPFYCLQILSLIKEIFSIHNLEIKRKIYSVYLFIDRLICNKITIKNMVFL